ncbi:uncharacterized protein [Epargyreus clarus]|uniref:uncharacterized protein n=1 Tax=Epargyreus clarus TaxID=520877 RepID=UPI003C2C768A
MAAKISFILALCLVCFLIQVQTSFIKPNNVPRVGRSNEAEGPFDQSVMGYVIKTIPSKNIPRMGRRNYDSENRFDIPKLYHVPAENLELYGDEGSSKYAQEQELMYGNQLENMKK